MSSHTSAAGALMFFPLLSDSSVDDIIVLVFDSLRNPPTRHTRWLREHLRDSPGAPSALGFNAWSVVWDWVEVWCGEREVAKVVIHYVTSVVDSSLTFHGHETRLLVNMI